MIPIVNTGEFAILTWITNGIGLTFAIVLVSIEWLARSAREKAQAIPMASQGKIT